MNTTKVFDMTSSAWLKKPRYISSCGGTRSGKTFSIIQLFYIVLLGEERRNAPPTVNSIVSESIPHLKRGAIRDFKTILQADRLWDDTRWSETDKVYTFANGSILEFFSVDNAGKVFGSARDRLFINECQHIDYEIARQLFVRTRGLIVLDYNPTHQFWCQDKIETKDNCITVHSTYRDNQYLSPEQVREIEDNRKDTNWWTVFGEGKVGTLEGLIYRFQLIDSLPEREEGDHLEEVQGMDFGFTNDPTARVQCLVDSRKKLIYARERCYQTHMQNRHIIADLQEDGIGRRVAIYADCAEPKSIAEISDAGFNIVPCDKNAPVKSDKLKFQLQWMQGWTLYVTKDSVNMINELRNYTWEKDQNNESTTVPIDKFNHCFTGDTLIDTEHGLRRIDTIEVGDKVWTSDGLKNVERLWKNGYKKIFNITLFFADFKVMMSVTPEHRIKVGDKWKKVIELQEGDTLWLSRHLMEGSSLSTDTARQDVAVGLVLQGIEICEGRRRKVYDLQVAECHEYFANGVLVHNCLDALRYAVWTRFGKDAGYGQYNISFNTRRRR